MASADFPSFTVIIQVGDHAVPVEFGIEFNMRPNLGHALSEALAAAGYSEPDGVDHVIALRMPGGYTFSKTCQVNAAAGRLVLTQGDARYEFSSSDELPVLGRLYFLVPPKRAAAGSK